MSSTRRRLMASRKHVSDNGEILDSWAYIIAAIHRGQAQKYYSLENWKTLDVGTEGQIRMKLVGFDVDTRSDGSGKAPTTWIGIELLKTKIKWHRTFIYKYSQSDLRKYYQNTIQPMIPEVVRNNLTSVRKKTQNGPGGDDEETTNEYIWAPGSGEVGGYHLKPYYASHWNGSTANVKSCFGSSTPVSWWLRDVYTNEDVMSVDTKGNTKYADNNNELGVPLCFCL